MTQKLEIKKQKLIDLARSWVHKLAMAIFHQGRPHAGSIEIMHAFLLEQRSIICRSKQIINVPITPSFFLYFFQLVSRSMLIANSLSGRQENTTFVLSITNYLSLGRNLQNNSHKASLSPEDLPMTTD